jgi:hypothetical protein
VLKRRARARGEFALHEHAVDVERGAVALVTVGAKLGARLVPREIGGGGHLVERAGGIAETKDVGVGSAADLDALDEQRIDGDAAHRLKVAERDIRRGDATHAIRLRGVDLYIVR